jgi:hypothetical protein
MSGYKYTNIAATTATVDNRLVTSTNMKTAAYTVANGGVAVWQGGFVVTATHTQVGGVTDTLGNIVVTGKDLFGIAVTDTFALVDGGVATGSQIFKSVSTVQTAGWVIDTGNDTIKVGVAAGSYVAYGAGELFAITVNTTANATVVISDKGGTIATLKASIAENTYYYQVPWSGFLKVATTSTNDVTLIHTPGIPSSYAMS